MADPNMQDEILHRLADGELAPDEEARVRKALSGDPQAQQSAQKHLRELEQLQRLMRAAGQQWQTETDPEALFARIEAGIRDEQPGTSANDDGQRAGERVQKSAWARLFGHRTWIPAAGAVAAAAAVLMTVYRPVEPEALQPPSAADLPPSGAPTAQTGSTSERAQEGPQEAQAPDGEPEPQAAVAPGGSSQVVQVDFGNHAGTVFDVALADGSSTAVIWINDEQ